MGSKRVALASLHELEIHSGVTGEPEALNAVLRICNQAVLSYLGREIEEATRTEFYDGMGHGDIALRNFPVNLATTPQVWLDDSGYYGAGEDAFASSTALTNGEDFVIVPNTSTLSRSGILRRLGTGLRGDILGRPYSSLAARYRKSVWPMGQGNIKVTYKAGYKPVPADISGAVLQMATKLYKTKAWGGDFINAGARLGEYSRGLASALNGNGIMADSVGTFAMLLAPYRELII